VKEQEEISIPDWQIQEVQDRLENYHTNPEQALDFDQAMDG